MCISRANQYSYRIPLDGDGINMLTNLKDGEICLINEIEAWHVEGEI